MSRLALYLLGPPRLERDGAPVQIVRRRALAVAAYLAMAGRPQVREQLMAISGRTEAPATPVPICDECCTSCVAPLATIG